MTRDVDENTPAGTNIGKPVSASDADNDVLVYTLGGTDTAKFSINSDSTGQMKVGKKRQMRVNPTQDDADDCNRAADSCVVMVTPMLRTRPGASDSQDVTIACSRT